jgi:hypothetical protein
MATPPWQSSATTQPYARIPVTPNAHALVQRFPLFDNFYDPSRQSADGHNWIVQAMAPYSDDIQSPDWLRDYPSNGGDAIAYQKKGHLWDVAAKAGVSFKNYGEYIEYNTFNPPGLHPSRPGTRLPLHCRLFFGQLRADSGSTSTTTHWLTSLARSRSSTTTTRSARHSPLPNLINNTVQNYPQFDLGIPDQFRVDVWKQDFAKDVAAGTVPQLEFMWISSTTPAARRPRRPCRPITTWPLAALSTSSATAPSGRTRRSSSRKTTRRPASTTSTVTAARAISSALRQAEGVRWHRGGVTDSTFYTQVNMTRTIEQILGLTPMNQNDLVASPMRTLFVDDPPAENFLPWTHVPNGIR